MGLPALVLVHGGGLAADSWELTIEGRAIAPKLQREGIEALGGVQTLLEIDTCHCMMVSEPKLLAETLAERCRSSAPNTRR